MRLGLAHDLIPTNRMPPTVPARAGRRHSRIAPSLARVLFVLALAWSLIAGLQAQTPRLRFDFSGTDPARRLPWTRTTVLETVWTTEGWRFGPGLSVVAPRDNRLAFSVTGGSEPTTLDEARAAGAHLAVVLAARSGSLDLSGHRVEFEVRRESWHAPRQYAVLSSVDGFASPLFVSPLLDNADDATDTFAFLLPRAGFDLATGRIEFRIVPFAARHVGHAASLTGFTVGTAAAIHRLSIATTPGGTVAASPIGTEFETGQTVTVTATPTPGHRFLGWVGAPAGGGNPLRLRVMADLALTARFAPAAPPRMDLGSNLEALNDWTTAWVFRDCFRLARTWLTRNADGSGEWDSGQQVPTDADGWPLAVPFDPPGPTPTQRVHTLLPLCDPGAYTVRFRGTGRIELVSPNGGGRLGIDGSGGTTTRRVDLRPTLEDRTLFVEMVQSSAADPIRRLEILAPGQDTDPAAGTGPGPFHPEFVASLAPYRLLRFMDWLQTNGDATQGWSHRTTASSYTQTRPQGAAHEFIILLANQTRKNPWICLPHAADDDQVRQTARLYRDGLDPDLEVYVEYSNETWNGAFPQTDHVQREGIRLGLDEDRWRAGQRYVARRSGEIFRIFAEEFGPAARHRFVAVLATQAAGAEGVTDLRIAGIHDPAVNPSRERPDALAIAPYFGVNLEPGTPVPEPERLVTSIALGAIEEALQWTRAHQARAAAQGWRLVCYEGGQHFVGILGAENDPALNAALQTANRDPRMQDRYREYLEALEAAGVDLFAHFTHIGEWSKWGTWSALEHQRQPAAEAPKWRALQQWADRLAGRMDPLQLAGGGDPSTRLLRAVLRPDRRHAIDMSDDLSTWTPVPGQESLRGDGIGADLPVPIGPGPMRFWRLRVE